MPIVSNASPRPARPDASARPCEVVLFHSVLGLRPGVRRWAERIRAAGHRVHVPDLYDGVVFDDIATGLRHVEALGGIPALVARSQAAVAELPQDLVYAGFSNGAASAELLAATRPGARGAILMHGALPADSWPAAVPLQIHCAAADPWVDWDDIRALERVAREAGAEVEVHSYPGSGHLFADDGDADYDERAAELMWERVSEFLKRV